MQLFIPTIAAQFDFFGGVLGIVAAIGVSFVGITLVASYYRFQNIVQMAEDTQPEEMGASPTDILRVQLARYLAGCARRGTSFSVSLIHVGNPDVQVRMGTSLIDAIKSAARHDDVTCVYDEQTAVLITEIEPEDSCPILGRITGRVAELCAEVSHEQVRVGIASYPGHGLSGKDLLDVASQGLDKATMVSPIVMPEIVDIDEEDEDVSEAVVDEEVYDGDLLEESEEDEKGSSGWKERRRNSMLDELTGVLKPSAVSAYMQRSMSEIRRKKERAALFCVGVNNMEHIARFHGSEAADDVMAGVSQVLQDNLRSDDLIGRHEKYAFLVLAQCSFDEAEIIGKRITTLVQHSEFISDNKKLKTNITLGVATYPEHGRNLHHLYTAGQKVLDYSRENDIRAYAVFDPQIHDKVAAKPMRNIKSVQA
jgi:diguanylate cyclase (GGDEF)-like protein